MKSPETNPNGTENLESPTKNVIEYTTEFGTGHGIYITHYDELMYEVVHQVMQNANTSSEDKAVRDAANAFFQTGAGEPFDPDDAERELGIEFWSKDTDAHKAFVEYLEQRYQQAISAREQ